MVKDIERIDAQIEEKTFGNLGILLSGRLDLVAYTHRLSVLSPSAQARPQPNEEPSLHRLVLKNCLDCGFVLAA